jgi:hypothetical protein
MKQKSIYKIAWLVTQDPCVRDFYYIRDSAMRVVMMSTNKKLCRHIVRIHNAALKAKE